MFWSHFVASYNSVSNGISFMHAWVMFQNCKTIGHVAYDVIIGPRDQDLKKQISNEISHKLFCSMSTFYVGSEIRCCFIWCILLMVRKSSIRIKEVVTKANNIG